MIYNADTHFWSHHCQFSLMNTVLHNQDQERVVSGQSIEHTHTHTQLEDIRTVEMKQNCTSKKSDIKTLTSTVCVRPFHSTFSLYLLTESSLGCVEMIFSKVRIWCSKVQSKRPLISFLAEDFENLQIKISFCIFFCAVKRSNLCVCVCVSKQLVNKSEHQSLGHALK